MGHFLSSSAEHLYFSFKAGFDWLGDNGLARLMDFSTQLFKWLSFSPKLNISKFSLFSSLQEIVTCFKSLRVSVIGGDCIKNFTLLLPQFYHEGTVRENVISPPASGTNSPDM